MKNKSYLDEPMDADELQEMMHQMIEAHEELKKAKDLHHHTLKKLDDKVVAIEVTIQESARKAVNDMILTFRDKVTSEIRDSVRENLHDYCVDLREVVKDSKFVTEAQDKEISTLWKFVIGAVIFGCLLGGILGGLTVHYFIPEITPELQKHLNDATLIENAWPKLSQKEQEKIIDLAQGKESKPTLVKATHNSKT